MTSFLKNNWKNEKKIIKYYIIIYFFY
jgi:hypothetical protein